MHVIHSLSGKLAVLPEPGEMNLAAVFPPTDIGLGSQDTGTILATRQIPVF